MYLSEFIEFLQTFPQDNKMNFISLRDNLKWEKQCRLDVDFNEELQQVNFFMYTEKLLEEQSKMEKQND